MKLRHIHDLIDGVGQGVVLLLLLENQVAVEGRQNLAVSIENVEIYS